MADVAHIQARLAELATERASIAIEEARLLRELAGIADPTPAAPERSRVRRRTPRVAPANPELAAQVAADLERTGARGW